MRCSCFRRCCRNLVMNFSENVFPKSLIFRCYCLSYTFCLLFCKFIKTLDISFEGLSHMVMWYGVLLIDKLKPYDDLNIQLTYYKRYILFFGKISVIYLSSNSIQRLKLVLGLIFDIEIHVVIEILELMLFTLLGLSLYLFFFTATQ